MTKEELAEQLSLSMDRDIPEEDIPSLELYMDQILTLVDRELGETRREEGEKLLTKTMVNNYTKEGLLKRIKGKTYSREHIRMLLLVHQMKQALPLQDLKRFLGGMEELLADSSGNYHPQGTKELYRDYLAIKERERRRLPQMLQDLLWTGEEGDEEVSPRQAVMALAGLSVLCKRAAQRLIDDYYGPKDEKK